MKRKIPYFYKTEKWYTLRKQVLIRDRHTCHYCKGKAVTADHIIPRSKGGGDVLSNLVAVCMPCNKIAGGRKFPSLIDKTIWVRKQLDKLKSSI